MAPVPRPQSGRNAYHIYGVRLESAWPLPWPKTRAPWVAKIFLLKSNQARFTRALERVDIPPDGPHWVTAATASGSTYLRWSGLFEFLIPPDGRSMFCRPLGTAATSAFQTHLGASLSFALINLGIEPLHATTVVVDGQAIALMGDCGYGKSSLGASFVSDGHPLLTDDLLVLKDTGTEFLAHPGVPRVKLFPDIARRILGPRIHGTRLEELTPKLIIPLDGRRAWRLPVRLAAIYMLTPPESRRNARTVGIRRLSSRRACIELVRNTFNMAVTDPRRLERQFALAARLALQVPIKSLSYPRTFTMLEAARDAILRDLQQAPSPRSRRIHPDSPPSES
jgi:hypothetical protein